MGKTGRREGREYTLRVLYAFEMTKNPVEDIFHDSLMGRLSAKKTENFSSELVHLCVEHEKEFDKIIRSKALNWEFHRIAILDRIVLRIGICELIYFPDIPPKVSINEAIEIAKKYSTEKSGLFVNGILDAVLQDLKDSGKFHKSGRGLVNG
ncbi:MAG TPA: transcription antitermination factor NusB [Bacteroidetes bacterium]|nr:transcription antitermination factor NusB [Bacteroidota bacterium]